MLAKFFCLAAMAFIFIVAAYSGHAVAAADVGLFSDSFEDIPSIVSCPLKPSDPVSGRCEVEQGDGNLLIRSHIATPNTIYRNAELLIDETGTIRCSACDCSGFNGYDTATTMNCPEILTTPGLINSHEHQSFQAGPVDTGTERYDHRHDWRTGDRGHSRISTSSTSSTEAKIWGELRHLLGGATSMIGSGSSIGLVRNLDRSLNRDGLDGPDLDINTFPLGDADGTLITSGCDYSNSVSPNTSEVYSAHIAVGINTAARNEWLCSSTALQGIDAALPGPSVVHGIAMTADDIPSLVAARAVVVWSPRSNIMLYGMTVPATMLASQGVNLVLGTDWGVTGSMNMLREFSCALEHNLTGLDSYFSNQDLLKMATSDAATAAGVGNKVGKIAPGFLADLTLFDASVNSNFAAAVEAQQEDVVLVLKAGEPLFGDAPVVEALSDVPGACDLMGDTVAGDCMANRRLCVIGETGFTYAQLVNETSGFQPIYSCGGPPAGEPTCIPARNEGDGIVYTGIPTPNDSDGDGVSNVTDNCPSIFNPPRPVDNFLQADGDSDGIGDACDTQL